MVMRQFIVDAWNGVMNYERNPLRHIPDLQVRHMVMQVLAFMWSGVFALRPRRVDFPNLELLALGSSGSAEPRSSFVSLV